MQQHRRSRSQTLPSQPPKRYSGLNSLSPADEADDEMSNASLTSPVVRSTSPVAISNRPLKQSPSSSSLVGSIYAIGGAVWNIIRGKSLTIKQFWNSLILQKAQLILILPMN